MFTWIFNQNTSTQQTTSFFLKQFTRRMWCWVTSPSEMELVCAHVWHLCQVALFSYTAHLTGAGDKTRKPFWNVFLSGCLVDCIRRPSIKQVGRLRAKGVIQGSNGQSGIYCSQADYIQAGSFHINNVINLVLLVFFFFSQVYSDNRETLWGVRSTWRKHSDIYLHCYFTWRHSG